MLDDLDGFIGPEMRDLALMEDGKAIAAAMPMLEHELGVMEQALEKRIFALIDAGTFSQQQALDAWLEKRAYARLLRRLTKHIRAGSTASERISPYMDGGTRNG